MKISTIQAVFVIIIVFFSSCLSDTEKYSHSPFHSGISGFTSGQISSDTPIAVEFSAPVESVKPGQSVADGIFSVKPSVKGKAVWVDQRTIVFKPTEKLPSGEEFRVEIDLPKILHDEEESFFFTFRTVPQNVWLSRDRLGPESVSEYNSYVASVRVQLADGADNNLVQKNVEVKLDGENVTPEWTHINGRSHLVNVKGIERSNDSRKLEIYVKKGVLSPDKEKSINLEVPAKETFKILSAKMENEPRKVITVSFSDPLAPGQDISGLIHLSNNDVDWSIDNNRVELFPDEDLTGEKELNILPEIKNVSGKKLGRTGKFTFTFSSEKPAVELLGEGTVMPYSDGLYLPFKAVSLKAVRVRIIKIYEHNIGHFLQINRLEGQSQLKRAGRLEHKQRIEINTDPTLDLNKWNTFSLDLSRFIQPDPGAIYRVE
ncbi:MAG: alpha-2-macroglobulin, partial [bacterium]